MTPTGLAATAGDGQVVLNWNRSANATGYNVKSSGSLGGTYGTIAAGVTGLSYTNTGLADGTTYYYEVSAVNSAGESTNSLPVSAEPVAATPPTFTITANGGMMQIAWPQNYIGWSLQVETNASGAGISTNWVTLPASTSTNQLNFPIDTTDGSVFFRMVSP